MTDEEFERLRLIHPPKPSTLAGRSLQNQTNRTLIYGYTTDRRSHHVYLFDGNIYGVVYRKDSALFRIFAHDNSCFVPTKRIYPGACDFEFCALLAQLGVRLPFTTRSGGRDLSLKYHGATLEGHS